jgi:hypothetical protein
MTVVDHIDYTDAIMLAYPNTKAHISHNLRTVGLVIIIDSYLLCSVVVGSVRPKSDSGSRD